MTTEYSSGRRPIVFIAFGTSTKAFATYTRLDQKFRSQYPDEQIIWAYSSRMITKKLQKSGDPNIIHPKELFRKLASQGVEEVVVQSLHLFPGKEFHELCGVAQKSPLRCLIGMPLLTSPTDYRELADILKPTISATSASAILILGHGTDHPIWVAYHCLENILNTLFDKKIYVGVIDKHPDSSHLVDKIAADGIKHICIIPFFLITGMHFRRDITSQDERSWASRLEEKDITVDTIDYGLGLYPGIEHLICRHVEEAKIL